MSAPEAELVRAFRPALLGDLFTALPATLGLHARADLPPATALRVALRLAELWRRVDPASALAVLDRLPADARSLADGLDAAALRCAALLERGDVPGAEALLVRVSPVGGRYSLLSARIALHRGDTDAALLQLAEVVEDEDPEVRAEALAFRARTLQLRGEPSDGDWERLDALLGRHGAGVMQSLLRVGRLLASQGGEKALSDAWSRATRVHLEASLCASVLADRASLGPIPLVVHGAARTHADDPGAYAAALLTVAACAWRAGDEDDAWAIAAYGARIGERRHGPRAGADLRAWMEGIADRVGPDRRAALDAELARRARAFAPPPGPRAAD